MMRMKKCMKMWDEGNDKADDEWRRRWECKE